MTMTKLSPATQTVLDAFLNGYICNPGHNVAFESDRNGLAAALRAVVEQVMPGRSHPHRTQLLAIAAELEAFDD